MNRMEELLGEALETQAEQVRVSPDAWAENQRRVHRARRVRQSAAVLGAAAAVTALAVAAQIVTSPPAAETPPTNRPTAGVPTPSTHLGPMPPHAVRLLDGGGGSQRHAFVDGGQLCVREVGGTERESEQTCAKPLFPKGRVFGAALGHPMGPNETGWEDWVGVVPRRVASITAVYTDGTTGKAEMLPDRGGPVRFFRYDRLKPGTKPIRELQAKDAAGKTIGTHHG
jgi:hypothetical protein